MNDPATLTPATVEEWEKDPLAAFQKNVAIAHATTLDAQADAKRIATGILAKVLGALAPVVAGAVEVAGAGLGPAGVALAPLIGSFIAGEAADYAAQHAADLTALNDPLTAQPTPEGAPAPAPAT